MLFGKVESGWVAWLYQRVSAVLLLPLAVYHFHFIVGKSVGSGALNYGELATRLSQPGLKILEFAFFVLILSHGLNGIWCFVRRWLRSSTSRALVSTILWVCGFVLVYLLGTAIAGIRPS